MYWPHVHDDKALHLAAEVVEMPKTSASIGCGRSDRELEQGGMLRGLRFDAACNEFLADVLGPEVVAGDPLLETAIGCSSWHRKLGPGEPRVAE